METIWFLAFLVNFSTYRFFPRAVDKSLRYKIPLYKCLLMEELCKPQFELPPPVPTEIITRIPKIWSLYWIYHGEAWVRQPAIWPLRAVMAKITSMQKSHQPQQLFIAMMKKWLSNKNRPRRRLQPHQQPQIWTFRGQWITERMAKIKNQHFSLLIWCYFDTQTVFWN